MKILVNRVKIKINNVNILKNKIIMKIIIKSNCLQKCLKNKIHFYSYNLIKKINKINNLLETDHSIKILNV